nr:MAG TPA: hypothetical protein [Caudoviricetes sp.]
MRNCKLSSRSFGHNVRKRTAEALLVNIRQRVIFAYKSLSILNRFFSPRISFSAVVAILWQLI